MRSLTIVVGIALLCTVTALPSYRHKRDVAYSKCENTYDQCNEWKKNGLCDLSNYKEYMTMQCPVACGLCQQGATFTQRSNIETPPESAESNESEGLEESEESGSGSGGEKEEAEKTEEKEEKPSNTQPQVPHEAPQEDERAEKYEDSEDDGSSENALSNQKDYKKTKQHHGKSSGKQNLLGQMVDSGKLKAYAVQKASKETKGENDEEEEEEQAQGNQRSLDMEEIAERLQSGSGLSGSGAEPNKLQVILKQSYDSKYGTETTPAFQILAGNFEHDVEEALGEDSEVSDISFSEAEVAGNPRVVGKVKVSFKFSGDYKKLQKLVDTGNINGMLVVKNSLEGSIFDN